MMENVKNGDDVLGKNNQGQPHEPGTFVIGLTMAGAVSGGAYTAGVLDFLIEALDAWEAKKEEEATLPEKERTVPRHKVLLQAASGASAGSMCAAILGFALPFDFPHVRWDQQTVKDQDNIKGDQNPFFSAWVNNIDIRGMLKTDDLKDDELPSLLNSQPVDGILDELLKYSTSPKPRPYVDTPFAMRFAVTNLRGVSYDVSMKGNSGAGHQMRTHADRMNFLLGDATPNSPLEELNSAVQIKSPPNATCNNWKTFGYSALASGAFPFFLKPRLLQRNKAEYDRREYVDVSGKMEQTFVLPDWTANVSDPFSFYCMDGGLMDNEPFELARQVLAGSPWDKNPREGDKANRAVIMIDPFVEDSAVRGDCGGNDTRKPMPLLTDFLMPMFDALVSNNRFKPNELALAHNPDVYSRFLVAPSRGEENPATKSPLAAGGLGAFLGFCHRSYRVHDYLLGRRNCQKFLREHLTLPWSCVDEKGNHNPVLKAGYATDGGLLPALEKAYKISFQVKDENGNQQLREEFPIIPLVGDLLTRDEPLPTWPQGKFQPDELCEAIGSRMDKVFAILKNQVIFTEPDKDKGFFSRTWEKIKGWGKWAGASAAWCLLKGGVVNKAIEAMEQSLKEQQLK